METVTELPTNRIKTFVRRHKVAITVVATSVVWYSINRLALKQHDDFLKERGLFDEFYTPSDDEIW